MKRIKHIAMAAATLAMVGVTGSALAADTVATVATNGIATTKHNLSSTGTFNDNYTASTTEICVFCHTPHAADSTVAAPLWNRSLNTTANAYQTYAQLGSSTLDGTIAAVGSVSLACLSCHDGTIAMDALINTPGSGTIAGEDAGWNFDNATTLDVDGMMESSTIAMLGTDLRNDHPVGVLYGGGGVTVANLASGGFVDKDFRSVDYVSINSKDYWYVDVNNDDKRTRTDMILYSRDESDGVKPYVECASCHDPHVVAFDAGQVAFLRVTNVDSNLCLACHIK